MLQGFPAETGVVRIKKEPPKLEGFYSEKARALGKLLALDKALTLKKELAAQKAAAGKKASGARQLSGGGRQLAVDALRRSQLAINGLRGLRWSMTFAAPVLTVLAAIALAIVAIASWRAAPATASIQPVQESTDVILPAAQSAPAQPIASQLSVPLEVNLPAVADSKISIRDESARVVETANPREPEPARVSTIGNFNAAQYVATSLQARLGAPVDEPAPAATPRPIPIEPPSERMEVAPIAVEQRPADPTPAIRDVIRRYEAAYERLDASAAKEIWPSLDERALARAFAGLASQTLRLDPCSIDVTGSSAVASCHGFATYVGRVGNRMGQVQRRDWTFVLHKSTDDWQIRSVRSNQSN